MKLTIELSDDEIAELRKEAAELGPLTKIETVAAWYLRYGWKVWQTGRQDALPLEDAPPPGAAGDA